MNLLLLGGTQFVGRHMVEEALRRNHTVTLFNRGNHPGRFPHVEQLIGDRNGDLSALEGQTWDAVIDVSGYLPRQVKQSVSLLKDKVAHYSFVSSISVYADGRKAFQDESAALAQLEDDTVEEITGETYGGLKVLCEQVTEALMPDKVLILRPGVVVGPYDPTDRFTYWPLRVADGGEVLAPEGPTTPVQFIDARDLAAFTLDGVETQMRGVFNVVTDPEQLSFGDLIGASKEASGSGAKVTWVDAAFLLRQGVTPWSDLPLWVPSETAGLLRTSNRKAKEAGLHIRPLSATVRATLEWAGKFAEHDLKAGLSKEREHELLSAWHSASK